MEAIPTDVTIDDLEQVLLEGESAVAEIRARQATALRVLDAIQINQHDGSRSMVEWTAARLDVTHVTARNMIDVAKASAEWPDLWESLRRGHTTFDRTVVTVKLATTGASGPKMKQRMRMAYALVSIAQDSLSEAESASGTSDPLVTVFVDGELAGQTGGEAGAEVEFGPRIGPATLERMLCTGPVQVVMNTPDGPVASHAARAIPPAVRRWVAWRDGGCTIDGCRSRYRLQPHHVQPWSEGGDHAPSNLTTLCWYHHHVVIHGRGYRIDPNSPPQRRRLLSPSGSDPPA